MTTLKTYKGCSDMPIYNFMMCVQGQDFSYLIANPDTFTESKIKEYVSGNSKQLTDQFEKISEEYRGLTFNKRELQKHKELASMMFLEIKHNSIVQIISLYIECKEIYVLDLLNEIDVPFDKTKPINPQLEKANRVTIGLRNKLNIKQANFKAKYKITDEQLESDMANNSDGIEKSLESQALIIEGNLETGYQINPRKTTVLRWIALSESNDRKMEQFNKA